MLVEFTRSADGATFTLQLALTILDVPKSDIPRYEKAGLGRYSAAGYIRLVDTERKAYAELGEFLNEAGIRMQKYVPP